MGIGPWDNDNVMGTPFSQIVARMPPGNRGVMYGRANRGGRIKRTGAKKNVRSIAGSAVRQRLDRPARKKGAGQVRQED
jgi:hypothetical protein